MATSLEFLESVGDLFRHNQWSTGKDTQQAFNGFCNILMDATAKQREMLLDISKDFQWVPSTHFHQAIRRSLETAMTRLASKERIFLMPLLRQEHYLQCKSCKFIFYLVAGPMFPELLPETAAGVALDTPLNITSQSPNINDAVIAVDDFIGTGSTCDDVVEEIRAFAGFPIQVEVCAMFGMELAVLSLQRSGQAVIVDKILRKGISENQRLNRKLIATYTILMTEIESRLKVPNKYRFGSQKSEALLSLDRAPNNTFPVYWRQSHTRFSGAGSPPFYRPRRVGNTLLVPAKIPRLT